MDIPKILRRLLALRRTAKDQSGTPEGDNATRHADAWSEKHGIDLTDEALETGEELIKPDHAWELELAVYIGHMLDLHVHTLRTGGVRLSGIRAIIDEAMSLYEFHHTPLERIVNFSMVGYIFGAMPQGIEKNIGVGGDALEEDDTPEEPATRISKETLENPSAAESAIVASAGKVGAKNAKPLWESFTKKGE